MREGERSERKRLREKESTGKWERDKERESVLFLFWLYDGCMDRYINKKKRYIIREGCVIWCVRDCYIL